MTLRHPARSTLGRTTVERRLLVAIIDENIEIRCPNCGEKHQKRVAQLYDNPEFACSCGVVIECKSDKFVAEVQKVDKSIEGLRRTLRDLGKRK
jgi:predicted RNA-binding Zn-ribbon protein involved in translation (DUF1610 family)